MKTLFKKSILLLLLIVGTFSWAKQEQGESVDVQKLLSESKVLKAESEKLYSMAKKLERESKDLQQSAEELEQDAEDLEDKARDLLQQSKRMDETIKLSRKDRAKNKTDNKSDVSESYLVEQETLLAKMRSNADELLTKAKKISLRVREMAEASDEKKGMADNLTDKADTLQLKAKELKEAADQQE